MGRRGEDEYCVGYDPETCGYIHPRVMFVDRALRPWPGGALSRLEARCGSLIRDGYMLAGLATLALLLIGLLAGRRWRGLLASSDPSAGRWRGLAQETEDGWTLMTDGEARPLDLSKARILGGKLAPGECRLVGSAQPAGDPYRGSHALVVARIASGDERSIAETIRLEHARTWAIILATMTVVAVPVLLAVLASYWGLEGL